MIYSNVSKWWGTDVKWHKRKCQLFPAKTLNMPIDSDVEGGVCACMCEGRSDQWRFPLLSSAQQQMGRGCGLVGWVTRIMNLPVVLFNTKKENENRNTKSKVGWLIQNCRHKRPGDELVLCWSVQHLSQQSFVTSSGGCSQKKKKAKPIYVTGANDRKDCQLMLNILGGGCLEI